MSLPATFEFSTTDLFIFDMEQYFKASETNFKETKVTLASMHLSDDAKLQWK